MALLKLLAHLQEPVLAVDDLNRIAAFSPSASSVLRVAPAVLAQMTCSEALARSSGSGVLSCCRACQPLNHGAFGWMDTKRPEAAESSTLCEGIRVRCLLDDEITTLIFLREPGVRGDGEIRGLSLVMERMMPAAMVLSDPADVAQVMADAALEAANAKIVAVLVHESGEPSVLTNAVRFRPGSEDVLGAVSKGIARVMEGVAGHHLPIVSPGVDESRNGHAPDSWNVGVPISPDGRVQGTLLAVVEPGPAALSLTLRILFACAGLLAVVVRNGKPGAQPVTGKSRLTIRSLGRFEASVNGQRIPPSSFRRRSALQLLKLLCAVQRRGLARETLADALWEDGTRGAGLAKLAVTLHSLKRVLEPDLQPGQESAFVRTEDDRVFLAETVTLDTDLFLAHRRRCLDLFRLGRHSEASLAGKRALDLYQGPFLGDEGVDEYSQGLQARLEQMFIELAVRIGRHYGETGQWDRAAEALRRIREVELTQSETTMEMIRSLKRDGRRFVQIAAEIE